MRPNRLKDLIADGGKAVNGWCAIPSAFSAEVLAHAGFDSVTIDLQHGLVDYQAAVAMLQAISTTEVTPLCRVPWLEEGIIMKMLDAGAYGVICPMVNAAADAERFVAACSYAPRGQRSFGPTRAMLYAGPDYPAQANDCVLKLAMIETVQAFEARDAILATDGLSGIYVGPSDLSLSMGEEPKLDPEAPAVVAAIEAILASVKAKGLIAGIHCLAPTYARRMLEAGFDLVTLASDARLLAGAAREGIAAIRAP